jgi:ABC-2 type transport system permease protein
VRYYFSVFYVLFQNSISRELQFNFNFVLQFIGNILWLLFSLLFFYIVYQHTDSINGWSMYQTFFLVNLNQFIIYIYQMFFAKNINQLSEMVRMGTLDNYIIKPIDLQFLISFRYIDLRPLFMLPLPLFIMIYIIKTNGYNFSW